jgi:serine/threonine protein kinase
MTDSEAKLESWMPPRSAPRSSSLPAPSARPSQLTGVLLDERYKIQGYQSRSRLARVYLAEDLESGGLVAIKTFSPSAGDAAEFAARVIEEAKKAAPIRHPNVVDLLGMGTTPAGLPYLVMEAPVGEPLDELLHRVGRLPTDLALVLARQAAAGLGAIHKAGLVHGEVTESNLMVLGAPNEPYGIKVLNYGLARLWDEPPPRPESASSASVEHMAPEQILFERLDPRTDVYGLAIVLVRLLVGHLPFEASAGPVLRHQLFSTIPQSTWLEAGLDPRLEALIVNATRKRPENRYSSMEELASDLDAVVGLSSGSVELRPLERTPDEYEPQTEAGRRRLEQLTRHFASSADRE